MQLALNTHNPDDNRLMMAMMIAIVIHAAIIFGVVFEASVPKKQRAMHLQYVEIKQRTQNKSNEEYDFASTVDQQGGGEKRAPDVPQKPTERQMEDPRNGQGKFSTRTPTPQNAAAQKTTETIKTQQSQIKQQKSTPKPQQTSTLTQAELIANINQAAKLEAKIEAIKLAESKLPNAKYVSASTKSFADAQYIEAWRKKVERLGNLNYPTAARTGKLNGTLILTVFLNPDGSIYDMKVEKPSGHSSLDQAAKDIVKAGQPYARVPRDVLENKSQLAITRTWEFSSNNRLSTR